jgi:17beta-estradiol 17-dehydrogenase / very-long-chain 3-oxoacyl-CoA reductase
MFAPGLAFTKDGSVKIGVPSMKCSVAVNNVGKQYTYPMYLSEVAVQELWDIININIGAATFMTRLLLPQMKLRGRGAIVNVSSSAELQPLPLMTVYAASKVRIQGESDHP